MSSKAKVFKTKRAINHFLFLVREAVQRAYPFQGKTQTIDIIISHVLSFKNVSIYIIITTTEKQMQINIHLFA